MFTTIRSSIVIVKRFVRIVKSDSSYILEVRVNSSPNCDLGNTNSLYDGPQFYWQRMQQIRKNYYIYNLLISYSFNWSPSQSKDKFQNVYNKNKILFVMLY